jgi:hypothetical protein
MQFFRFVTHIAQSVACIAPLCCSEGRSAALAMSSSKPAMPIFDTQTIFVVLKKFASINSQPTEETFPELPNCLIWVRCFVAIVYGSVLGSRNVRGGLMVLNAINLLCFLPIMYCRFFLGTGAEEFRMALLFSGILPSIALFLLVWIYFYTEHHELAAEKLATMLLQLPVPGLSNETLADVSDDTIPLISDAHDGEF